MSLAPESYPFVEREPGLGAASLAPVLPLTLIGSKTIQVSGLLDTGATVNVLPYTIGQQLGMDLGPANDPGGVERQSRLV